MHFCISLISEMINLLYYAYDDSLQQLIFIVFTPLIKDSVFFVMWRDNELRLE